MHLPQNLMNLSFKIAIPTSIIIILDQITKAFATKLADAFQIIPNWIELELHHNMGIALSLPLYGHLQIIIILAILLFGIRFFIKTIGLQKKLNQIIFASILGGAIGNLVDRFCYGYVIDFIAIWNFPVFNLADIFIFLGVCGLLYLEFKKEKK